MFCRPGGEEHERGADLEPPHEHRHREEGPGGVLQGRRVGVDAQPGQQPDLGVEQGEEDGAGDPHARRQAHHEQRAEDADALEHPMAEHRHQQAQHDGGRHDQEPELERDLQAVGEPLILGRAEREHPEPDHGGEHQPHPTHSPQHRGDAGSLPRHHRPGEPAERDASRDHEQRGRDADEGADGEGVREARQVEDVAPLLPAHVRGDRRVGRVGGVEAETEVLDERVVDEQPEHDQRRQDQRVREQRFPAVPAAGPVLHGPIRRPEAASKRWSSGGLGRQSDQVAGGGHDAVGLLTNRHERPVLHAADHVALGAQQLHTGDGRGDRAPGVSPHPLRPDAQHHVADRARRRPGRRARRAGRRRHPRVPLRSEQDQTEPSKQTTTTRRCIAPT